MEQNDLYERDDDGDSHEEISLYKLGENVQEKLSWPSLIEKKLYTIYSVITEEQKLWMPFAALAMITSFLQVIAILLNHDTMRVTYEIFHEDLQVILNIFRFYSTIVSTNNRNIYLMASGLLFAIQVLYFVLLFFVLKYEKSGKKNHSFLVKLECVLTPILYWVLLNPTVEFYASIVFCDTANKDHTEVQIWQCWSNSHLLAIFASTFAFIIFLANTYMISVIGNDCNPYNEESPFARYPWNFELWFAIFRIALSLFFDFSEEILADYMFDGAMFLISSLFTMMYLRHSLYYNQIINNVFGACLISLTWVNFNSLLVGMASNLNTTYRGHSIVLIVGILLSYNVSSSYIYYVKTGLMKDTMVTKLEDDREIEMCLHHAIVLINSQEQGSLSRSEELFLMGYLYMQMIEWANINCPLTKNKEYYVPLTGQTTKKDGFPDEDKVRVRYLLLKCYMSKIKHGAVEEGSVMIRSKNIANAKLCIAAAYYQIYVIGNYHSAIIQLEKAESIDQSFSIKCAITEAKRLVKQHQEIRNSRKQHRGEVRVESLDLRMMFKYEHYLAKFRQILASASNCQKIFYTELLLPLPDLNKLHNFGLQILESYEKVEGIWKKLNEIGETDSRVQLLYGLYLFNVRNNKKESSEHFRLGHFFSEKQGASSIEEFAKDKQTMFTENSAVVAVGAAPNNLNQIVKVSNGIMQILGYSPADIIGKDLGLLMPAFIAKEHETYVKAYLSSGRSAIIDKPYETYAIDKEHYVLKIFAYIREYYDIHFGQLFLGMIQAAPVDEGIILTDAEGKILNISYDINALFPELTPTAANEQDIYLSYICPDLSAELNNVEYPAYEGSLMLTFCAPKNIQDTTRFVYNGRVRNVRESSSEFNPLKKFDYSASQKVKRWCNITKISSGKDRIEFKRILLSKSGNGLNNSESTSESGNKKCELLDYDSGKMLKNKKEDKSQTKTTKSCMGIQKVKNAFISLLTVRRSSLAQEQANDYGRDLNPEVTSLPTLSKGQANEAAQSKNAHLQNEKNENDFSQVNKIFIEKEIKAIRNSSLSNFKPKFIMYAHWGITLFLIVAVVFAITAYIFHYSCISQIEHITEMTKWTRAKYILMILEAVRSLTLTGSWTTEAPILNISARSGYNYASIGYNSVPQMNYREWKLNDIKTYVDKLDQIKNAIQMQYITYSVDRQIILPSNIYWLIRRANKFTNNTLIIHSILTMVDNTALQIFNKLSKGDNSISDEAKLFVDNGLKGVTYALKLFPVVSLSAAKGSFDNESLLSFLFLIIMAAASAICLLSFLPLLYYINKETNDLLKLFMMINSNRLKHHIENCSKFNSLLNYDENSSRNTQDQEQEQEYDNAKTDEETPEKDEEKRKLSSNMSNRSHVQYNGSIISRMLKTFFICFAVLSYTIYFNYVPPQLFAKITHNLNEIASFQMFSIYELMLYALTMEFVATNGTAILESYPLPMALPLFRQIVLNSQLALLENHRANKDSFSQSYNQLFNKIFYESACQSQAVSDLEECKSFKGSVLSKGIYVTASTYYEMLTQLAVDFASRPGALRTLDYIKSVVNSRTMIEAEILNKKYILPACDYVTEAARNWILDLLDSDFPLMTIIFALFMAFCLFAYFVFWRLFRDSLRRNLFSAKVLFSYVPLELITENPKLARHVVQCTQDFIKELKE